jgi:hypothetical protein
MVGPPNSSLPELVAEYFWVTITNGYLPPEQSEIERWQYRRMELKIPLAGDLGFAPRLVRILNSIDDANCNHYMTLIVVNLFMLQLRRL